MADETTPAKASSVNDTITAVAALAEAIPVYQDALQPAAKELGKSLEVAAKFVGIAMAPLRGMVWGYERIEKFINESVSKRLADVPEENIITPATNIVGPAVEALRFSGDDEILRELYSNLIASAMNKETSFKAHPAFVDIIKSMSAEEALIMKHFSESHDGEEGIVEMRVSDSKTSKTAFKIITPKCSLIGQKIGFSIKQDSLTPTYLDNLCRLGLLENPELSTSTRDGIYEDIANYLQERKEILELENPGEKVIFSPGLLHITNFGRLFIDCVILEKS